MSAPSQNNISENHPIWIAIDEGGGQVCDIPGIIRELNKAGFSIVPYKPTPAMIYAGFIYCSGTPEIVARGNCERQFSAMIDAALAGK